MPGRRRVSKRTWRTLVALFAGSTVAAMLFVSSASAAIVPTVLLGTSANYAVLGGSTVTNVLTVGTVLDGSLGLWPGTSITGFPPGLVLPPGTIDNSNAAAQQAQSDLTVAYVDAAGRSLDATTAADLVNLHLAPGVYAGPNKGALLLSGPLTLDGGGDPTAVFIFQTNSSLTTASASTVTLINGAQECNVFWQIGSSATLGTGSVFRGNILALSSITVTNGVTVHGRALARNAAVTLDNDTFVRPTCATATPATTTTAAPVTTTAAPGATTTTAAPGATTSTTAAPGATTTTAAPAAVTTTTAAPAAVTTTTAAPGATPTTVAPGATLQPATTSSTAAPLTALGIIQPTVPTGTAAFIPTTGTGTGTPSVVITDVGTPTPIPALPSTGAPISTTLALAAMLLTLGALATGFGRAKR